MPQKCIMKILVTGANGFVGKNLTAELKNRGYGQVFSYDLDTPESCLDEYCRECGFVFHLAGVNRPREEKEFMEGNYGFTSVLLEKLKKYGNKAPVLVTSSIQAELDNAYGKSKKAGEELIWKYGEDNDVKTYIYRLPNVFGKWCRPNYNSAVATFCSNIASGLPIVIHNRETVLNLVYIDDVVNALIGAMDGEVFRAGQYCAIPTVHAVSLGRIADLLYAFKASRETRAIPDMSDPFVKKLYSTYLSYLPEDAFSYPLKMNVDNRGSFTEIFRTEDRGQVSVNISKPGITKGNHWHHTKNEKFIVVSGKGVIRFRKPGGQAVIEYFVSGDKMEVVDIPVGYTHNIENLGDTDMVTIMWCNECFDPDRPDTYYLEV